MLEKNRIKNIRVALILPLMCSNLIVCRQFGNDPSCSNLVNNIASHTGGLQIESHSGQIWHLTPSHSQHLRK